MPLVSAEALWEAMRAVFELLAGALAAAGFGEAGGRAAAAILLASALLAAGAFRVSRVIAGALLAALLLLVALSST
jgi:hypothetical protein